MDPMTRPGQGGASFGGLEASSLYCRRCGQAQPVRRKLLLVLPKGEKYAYYCAVCGDEVGSKIEQMQTSLPWSIR